MKEYICVNHINCAWADEKPPRKFTLANDDEPCPECGKFNIKEVKRKPSVSLPWRVSLLLLAVLIIMGLMYKIWHKTSEGISGGSGSAGTTQIPPPVDTATPEGLPKQEGRSNLDSPQPPVQRTITWTRVQDSEFCVGDCIVEYSEKDNLGHVRAHRVGNYAKCCSADK